MFVDSSFLVGLARGHEPAVSFYGDRRYEEYSAPTIVAHELFGGLVDQGREDIVDELRRDLDWVDFVTFDLDDAAETARLEGELESDGVRIRTSDVMIAAAARRRGETLVAADEQCKRIDDLDYVNFRDD